MTHAGEHESMHPHVEKERRVLTPEEALAFVREGRYGLGDIPENGGPSRCVDGRYARIEGLPGLAQPGADVSDLLVALAGVRGMGIDAGPMRKHVLQVVVESLGGAKKFKFHSDNTHAHEGTARGCGHLKQAGLDPKAYGLIREDMDAVFGELSLLEATGAEETILLGGHEESAVIIVDSQTESLYPRISLDGRETQLFVFQAPLHRKRLDTLARVVGGEFLKNRNEKEVRAAMNQAFEVQLAETLRRLAKGLPIFTTKIENGSDAEITPVGIVS